MSSPGQQPGPMIIPGEPRTTNAFAVAGFVLALLGLLGSFIPLVNIPAILLAVVGLVLAIFGIMRARYMGVGKGLSLAGIILGALAVVIGIVVNVAFLHGVNNAAAEPGAAPQAVVVHDAEADRLLR